MNFKDLLLKKQLIDKEEYPFTNVYVLDKNYLTDLYKLRLQITSDKEIINNFLKNLNHSEGNKILSILIVCNDYSKSFFTNEKMDIVWGEVMFQS